MTEALNSGAAEIPETRTSEETQALGTYMIAGNLHYLPITPSEREFELRRQMPVEVADLVPYDLVERFEANYGQPLPSGRKLPASQQDKLTQAAFDFAFGIAGVLRQGLTPIEAESLQDVARTVPQNGVHSYLNGHQRSRSNSGDTYLRRLAADAKSRLPDGLDYLRYTLRQPRLPLEVQIIRLMNRQAIDRHRPPVAAGSSDILTAFGLWLRNADQSTLFS
jgi:hypothetical protein